MSDKLGYQDNTAGPGKESFKPKGGDSGNKHGNAPQQDGTNEKDKVNAGDHLWDLEDSEGADCGHGE